MLNTFRFHKPSPWTEERVAELIEALDELCVTSLHTPLNPYNPVKSLKDLIAWEVSVALDPAVSSSAQALIERGRVEQLQDIFGAR